MVRRSVPLGRRLRALRGQIFLACVWMGSAALCVILLLLSPGASRRTAVAVIRSHQVAVPESGRLAEVNVAPLQIVEAGAVLATIEVPGLSQEIAAAVANLRAVEEEMATDEADRGRKFAKDLEGARAQWLSARVELERERAVLAGLDEELKRIQAPGVALSVTAIDATRTARNAARASVDAREAEVESLNRSYDSARIRSGANGNAALKAALEAATVEVEALRMRMDANVLRANVAGVIDSTLPTAGQWVQAGVPLMTVTEPSTHDAVVFVDIHEAQNLTPGTLVSVLDGGGRRNEAAIRTVGVAVQEVPLRQLREVDHPEWGVPVTLQVLDRVLTPGEALAVDF